MKNALFSSASQVTASLFYIVPTLFYVRLVILFFLVKFSLRFLLLTAAHIKAQIGRAFFIFCVKASLISPLFSIIHRCIVIIVLYPVSIISLPTGIAAIPLHNFFLNCVKNTLLSCSSTPVFFREKFS